MIGARFGPVFPNLKEFTIVLDNLTDNSSLSGDLSLLSLLLVIRLRAALIYSSLSGDLALLLLVLYAELRAGGYVLGLGED